MFNSVWICFHDSGILKVSLIVCILKASLISWTKGFTAEGVVGQDVVKMLREAIDRRGVCIFFSFMHVVFIRKKFLISNCSSSRAVFD